jgi:dTDP-4-dehydrorhamnose reductase
VTGGEGLPRVETTPVPGLLVVRLALHADARGWFAETWQREKMLALGLPDFGPVQHNVSFNHRRGTTRGIHTEPWDKFVTVVTGRAFAAWVDMRAGETFGAVHHLELEPGVSVFVPRGVGNSYQCLTEDVTYSYLVNDHWRPGIAYPALALDDPASAVPWPLSLAEAAVSEKDRRNPRLADVTPVPPRRTVVLGAHGQVGRALVAAFPGAEALGREELDLADAAAVAAHDWSDVGLVLNAAAYTAVDDAETGAGRREAWAANAVGPAALARAAARHGFTIVHVSTDYVYDGVRDQHVEDEAPAPLGVYGQSKAAGDLAVSSSPRHYLLRTSWVIGEGGNFVRTMQRLAARGVSPGVVDDQVGRLTFADELARATRHLVGTGAPYGTYHVSNAGPPTSWHAVARRVFELAGRDPRDVTATSTEEYATGRDLAPRPRSSVLSLERLRATGFEPEDAMTALERYCGTSERP